MQHTKDRIFNSVLLVGAICLIALLLILGEMKPIPDKGGVEGALSKTQQEVKKAGAAIEQGAETIAQKAEAVVTDTPKRTGSTGAKEKDAKPIAPALVTPTAITQIPSVEELDAAAKVSVEPVAKVHPEIRSAVEPKETPTVKEEAPAVVEKTPVVEKPATKTPTVEEEAPAVVEKTPVVEKPATKTPTVEEEAPAVVEKTPVVEKPATKTPTVEEEAPAVVEKTPVVEKPAAEKPAVVVIEEEVVEEMTWIQKPTPSAVDKAVESAARTLASKDLKTVARSPASDTLTPGRFKVGDAGDDIYWLDSKTGKLYLLGLTARWLYCGQPILTAEEDAPIGTYTCFTRPNSTQLTILNTATGAGWIVSFTIEGNHVTATNWLILGDPAESSDFLPTNAQ